VNIGIFLKIKDCEGGGHLICRVILYSSKYGISTGPAGESWTTFNPPKFIHFCPKIHSGKNCSFCIKPSSEEFYRVHHLMCKPPRKYATAAASKLLENETVTTQNIAVAC
jgi:hypothetical protein